jgi:F0F1-type ATP synthase epsilon subunit
MILLELGSQGFYTEKHIKYVFYDIDDDYDTIEEGHVPALVGGRAGYLILVDEKGNKEFILFKGGYLEYDGEKLKVALRERLDPKKLDPQKLLEKIEELNQKLLETEDEKEKRKLEEEILTTQKLYLALVKLNTYFENK